MSVAVDLAELRWSDWGDDPYPLYRVLRDEQPVYYDAPNDGHVLTRYEDVAAVMRDHRGFSSVPLAQASGAQENLRPIRDQDPPLHTWRRRIVAPLFTSGQMRGREAYFHALAREILAEVELQDEVEVSSEIGARLAGRVTLDLLGLPQELHARFEALTYERLRLMAAGGAGGARTIEAVRADLWELVRPVAEQRRDDPRVDGISLLVQAQGAEHGDDMTEAVFVDMLLHLLAGGFETTQHLIELLISLLADRPDLWRRLGEERSLIDSAIEELLRWDAPFQASRRRPLSDVVIRGVEIAENATVFAVLGAANRDERVYADPDEFQLGRQGAPALGFGLGIHYCPGAPVSRYEVRALLSEMLDRYAAIERCGPSELSPRRYPMTTVESMRGLARVPVRLQRR